MRIVLLQTLFFATYLLFLLSVHRWARSHARRRAEEECERLAALEREWRVGIPYDP